MAEHRGADRTGPDPAEAGAMAEFIRAGNPAGRPLAGIELTELGFPSDPSLGGVLLAAGHLDPAAMAAAVDDYDRWCEAYDPDWPTTPAPSSISGSRFSTDPTGPPSPGPATSRGGSTRSPR
jgi:hypothetical protein